MKKNLHSACNKKSLFTKGCGGAVGLVLVWKEHAVVGWCLREHAMSEAASAAGRAWGWASHFLPSQHASVAACGNGRPTEIVTEDLEVVAS